jgi:hypothetical protein
VATPTLQLEVITAVGARWKYVMHAPSVLLAERPAILRA